jgi:2-polyprenyl-3-methyl-5-hydroxy-6-metoxy-1,4-benzoquinol methylase
MISMSSKYLAVRQRQPEVMDQPGLDERMHRQALEGIQRVNNISRIGHVLWWEIDRIVTERRLEKVRILDLACGGGGLAIWLARQGQRSGLEFTVKGCDISPTAVLHANEQSLCAGVDNARFFELDALDGPLDQESNEEYDIVMCSLFLHHLEDQQVITLLRKMAETARHAVIINDLRRTRLGYGLAWIGCRLLTRSPIVHADGPLSVQSAFTIDEARSLAKRAGLRNVTITTHWPQRFLMTWQRT